MQEWSKSDTGLLSCKEQSEVSREFSELVARSIWLQSVLPNIDVPMY